MTARPSRSIRASNPAIPASRAQRTRCDRRGVLLLEIVFSLAILLSAIAVCGAAIHNSMLAVERAEQLTRATMLTENLFMQLDTSIVQPEEEQTGFSSEPDMPGLSWKLEIRPDAQQPELLRVTATIYEGDPNGAEDQRRTVLATRTMRPKPRTLNLKNDFGMSDEQLKLLTDAIPGGTQSLDPENFDPRSLAGMDMDTLTQLLPALMAALSSQMGGGAGQLPGDLGSLTGQLSGGQGAAGQAGNRTPRGSRGASSGGSGTQSGGRSGGSPGTRNPQSGGG